jgi:excisionase family DNA binding protein
MKIAQQIEKPSKLEQIAAEESYRAIESIIEELDSEETEIEIHGTNKRIKIPTKALKSLGEVLKAMGQGTPVSIVSVVTEVTTQKAAEIIGCSRPYLVKLLEAGEIEFTRIGKHRRIKLEDIEKYKQLIRVNRRNAIIDMIKFDEELGLYE